MMGTTLMLLRPVAVVAIFMLLFPCRAAGIVSQKMGNITFECPDGWEAEAPYCYLFASLPMSLEGAKTSCKKYGAELVQIQDEEEAMTLGKKASEKMWSLYWIGNAPSGEDEICGGFWDVGQPLTTTPFKTPIDVAATLAGVWQEQKPVSSPGVKTILPYACRTWACVEGTFRCKDGKICISDNYKCDGEYDCEDESDESDCSDRCTKSEQNSAGKGTIKADAGKYKAGETCMWFVEGGIPGNPLSLKILDMNVAKDVARLEVWGGGPSLATSQLLQTLDGTYTKDQQKMVFGTNNFLIVRLVTDQGSDLPSFEAEWEEDAELSPEDRKITATDQWTDLTSPYLGQREELPCAYTRRYTVSTDEGSLIRLEILEDDIGGGLKYDISTLTSVGQRAAAPYPDVFISLSNTFTFEITATACPSKFKARVKKGCTVDATHASGIINAPVNGNSEYPASAHCTYTIRAPADAQRSFSIRGSYNFTDDKDRLKIYDGNSSDATDLTNGGLTSVDFTKTVPIDLKSTGPVAFVEFTSSLAQNAGRFILHWSIECPALNDTNMQLSSKETTLGITTTVQCDKGYTFAQEEFENIPELILGCELEGKWNVTRLPTCQVIYCGIPELIVNGYISDGTDARYGSIVTYDCFRGFTLKGKADSTCGDGAQWSARPSCEASKCQALTAGPNRIDTLESGSATDFGAIFNFTCDDGYELIGSRYTLCKSDGSWSHLVPLCQAIKCPIPFVKRAKMTVTQGGQSVTVNESSEALPLNTELTVTCGPGYRVNASTSGRVRRAAAPDSDAQFRCLSSGTFDISRDLCVDDNECEKLTCPDNNMKCLNTEGSFTCECKEQYQKVGNTCSAINKCNLKTSGCDTTNGKCTALGDGAEYKCECNDGYVLFTEDGLSGRQVPGSEDGLTPGDVLYINHTCVPVTCTVPAAVDNGQLLTKKKKFDFGETVSYECDFGYEPSGNNVLTCKATGQWDITPGCNAIMCDALKPTGVVVNVYPDRKTVPGEEVKLECRSEYTGQPYNKTLYCARQLSSFVLKGDNPHCPGIDCGNLDPTGGANFTLSGTVLGAKFTYECSEGYKLDGMSTTGNDEVTCEKTGRWGLGNLTCKGQRCTDPGTPGGTAQTEASFELGGSVVYKCNREGYKAVPENRTCRFTNNKVEWDSAPPKCVDVEEPIFENCPTAPTKLKMYETAGSKIATPNAKDNSGLVYYSVDPKFFTMDQHLEAPGFNVTYTATDPEGNTATCVLTIQVNDPGELPTLPCSQRYSIAVKNETVMTYNFTAKFQNFLIPLPEGRSSLEFDIDPLQRAAPDTVGEMPVRATLTNEFGLQRQCAFIFEVLAFTCLQTYLEPVNNASVNCGWNDTVFECNTTCDNGFAYADGSNTRTYQCQDKNVWSPPLPIEPCLKTEPAKYLTVLTITYLYADIEDCEEGIKTELKQQVPTESILCFYNYDIKLYFQVEGTNFSFPNPNRADIELRLGFRSDINEFAVAKSDYQSCYARMSETSNLVRMLGLTNVTCGNKTASVLPLAESVLVSGEKACGVGSLLHVIGGVSTCVKCQPGTYHENDSCKACPDGQYQDLAGQTQCKNCDNPQQHSTEPRSSPDNCVPSCPLGFASGNAYRTSATDINDRCVPCNEDEYLDTLFTASCKNCSEGTTTAGVTGATKCIAKCGLGQYPLNNTHCSDCPVGFYKSTVGNAICTPCPKYNTTKSAGSNSSSDCDVPIENPEKCTTANVDVPLSYCVCNVGYEGENCDQVIDACQSNPCYNGGKCNTTRVMTFTCDCPKDFSGDRCENDDKNDCTNDTCSELSFCRDMVGSADCICPSSDKYSGPRCEVDLNVCTPDPCKNGGDCKDSGNGVRHTCVCKAGFTGVNCENNIDECTENPGGCLNGGNCTDGINSYTCACGDYKGEHCQTLPNFCADKPTFCQNGVCYNNYTMWDVMCFCEFPFRLGVDGRCEEIDVCSEANPCQNNATCSKVSPGVTSCACEPGYNGSLCQHDIDDCATPGLCNNGKCKDLVNDFECECNVGWEGKYCDNNTDDRPKATCDKNNTDLIEDLVNGFKCVCKVGFTGDNCETDIDECLSLPCQHGGACSQSPDTPGKYSCACQDGWTGDDCDQLNNFCRDDICEAGGTCHSLQEDYFCECLGGSTGKNCSTFRDLCDILDPCMAPYKCERENNKASCSCPADTYGSSCNLIKNACLGDPCENGGTCTLKGDGYSCKCNDGFEGSDCSKVIPVCTSSTCPTDCVEVKGKAVCLCGPNQVKSGDTCKNVSNDFDIVFTKRADALRSTQPFRMTKDVMTLMFWLAPLEDSDTEPAVQLKTGSDTNILAVYSLNVTFLTDSVALTKGFKANQWNHFCVSWTSTSYEMYLNGENFQSGTPPAKLPSTQNELVFIYIGADFKGSVSQVTVWDRVLSFVEVLNLLEKPLKPFQNDVLALWGHYGMATNIWSRLLIPSTAIRLRKVCEDGKTGDACDGTKPDKVPPGLNGCPTEDQVIRTKRLVQIGNLGITGDQLQYNLDSSLLTFGVHRLVFMAQDEQNNVAFCRFNMYIKLLSMTPDSQTQVESCNAADGLKKSAVTQCAGGLKIQCPNSDLSIFSPVYLTCGNLGSYNLQNPFMLPQAIICGATSVGKRTLTMSLRYKLGITCFSQALTEIKESLLEKVKELNQNYTDLCPDSSCSNVDMSDIKCQGRFVNANVVIKEVPELLAHNNVQLTAKEVLQTASLENDVFKINELYLAELQKNVVKVTEESVCEAGSGIVQSGNQKGSCVKCTRGSYVNEKTKTCELCPLGHFTYTDGATSCKPCPAGQTTLQLGSTECTNDCVAGNAFNMIKKACEVCPKDFYSNVSRQVYCDPCPANTDSESEGTTTILDCYETCEAGTELNGSLCVDCPRGSYSDGVDVDRCEACPLGKTTPDVKSTSKSSCSQTACDPGSFLNKTNACVPCDYGFYQPHKWKDTCLKCNDSYTTVDPGSTSPEQCLFTCVAGKESLDNKTCTSCKKGFYRTDSMDDRFELCTPCNSTFTTAAAGSTSSDRCTVRICYAGNYLNVTENECYPCPVGEYQPDDQQTKCFPCPKNTMTRQAGSENQTQCLFFCRAGYEVLSADMKDCQPCERGLYKSNEGSGMFEKCKPCPANTTNDVGSESADDCNIKICTSGQKLASDGSCEDCPVDTYQDIELPDLKTDCRKCPDKKGTKEDKRTSALDCEPYCEPGEQYDGTADKCVACPMGTYNNGSATQRFEPCTQCTDGYVTAGEKTGATTQDECTLRDCPAGKFIDGEDCTPCPVGEYQDSSRKTTCKPCKADTNTSGTGSASESDCTISCVAGKEQKPNSLGCTLCEADKFKPLGGPGTCQPCTSHFTSGATRTKCDVLFCDRGFSFRSKPGVTDPTLQCEPCVVGTYKDTRGNLESCTECLGNTTTAATGATSKGDCTKANCAEGFFSPDDMLPCQPCPLATYKNVVGNINCTPCDAAFTTEGEASTDPSACSVVVCSKGQKRNAQNMCEDCPTGTFQNETGQTMCYPCSRGYTTTGKGKTSESDCKIVCSAGSFRDDGTNTCKECPAGEFQPAAGQTSCTKCQTGYTTAQNGSKASTDCYVVCKPGEYAVSRDKCEPCPLGQYQSTGDANKCSSCETGNTTLQTGSTSADDCMPLCGKGEFLNTTDRECLKCTLGTYNAEPATVSKTIQSCTQCPSGNTTATTGATSANECNIFDCLRGSKRSTNGGCEECPIGQYQPDKSQTSCIPCSPGNTTLKTGRFFSSSCVDACPAGTQYDFLMSERKCVKCPINFIRVPAETTQCVRCPVGQFTVTEGEDECTPEPGNPTPAPITKRVVKITVDVRFLACRNNEKVNQDLLFGALWEFIIQVLLSPDAQFGGKICNGNCKLKIKVKVKSGCLAGKQRNKRATIDPSENSVDIEIPDMDDRMTDVNTGKVYDSVDVIKAAFYDAQAGQQYLDDFDMEFLGVVSAEALISCSPGQTVVSAQCQPCAAGTYSTNGAQCIPCEKNTYQSAAGQTSCFNCTEKTYTSSTGATSASQCLRKCQHSDARKTYCSGNGNCVFDASAADGVRCVCDENRSGVDCSVREAVSDDNTEMVAGIVGGICAFLIILLIIFGVVACLRRDVKKAEKKNGYKRDRQEDGRSDSYPNYNYPAMFDAAGRPFPMGAPAMMYTNPDPFDQDVRDFYNDQPASGRSNRTRTRSYTSEWKALPEM